MCLALPGVAGHFVEREDGVVGRVVGVVAGRAVDGLAGLGHGQVVGDRDRFVMRHEVAVLRPGGRRPGAHARSGAGTHEVDRAIGAELVVAPFRRHLLLVRSPAEFSRLQPFRHEAFDAPGIDEGPHGLRRLGALRVPFGDVDALDAERHGEPSPVLARRGRGARWPTASATLSSACLTNQDTMPGLAPQVLTAVGPPGRLRRRSISDSRKA